MFGLHSLYALSVRNISPHCFSYSVSVVYNMTDDTISQYDHS